MNELRREAAHLLRELERHRQREAGLAVALLELERHPGYRFLDSGGATGRTARRWAAAVPMRDRLWRDFRGYGARLGAAEQVRVRRPRPGPDEVGELRELLRDPDGVVARMRTDLDELRRLAATCDGARGAVLAALAGPAERLVAIRRGIARLGLAADDPDVVAATELTGRLAGYDERSTADPLEFAGVDPNHELAASAEAVARLHARITALLALRARWEPVLDEVDDDVAALATRRAHVVTVRDATRDQLRDPVPPLPADPRTGLRELVAAARTARGWRARYDAVATVRERIAVARSDLDAVVASTAELLERRDDLRGRFVAYRARSRRLGHTGDPELSDLDIRIGERLWTVPSEIGRATRELAAYRRRLAALDTG